MPLSVVDAKAALIVIDLQKGIVGMETAHPTAQIVERSAELAAAFRANGLPVVLVHVTGMAPGRTDGGTRNFAFPPEWAEFVEASTPQEGDIVVEKQRWGALIGTGLHETLRAREVTQVFLAGISTSGGVESTGRSASDFGYNVVYVTDAMTDRELATHQHSVEKIFPRMGETDTTENVLAMLRNRK